MFHTAVSEFSLDVYKDNIISGANMFKEHNTVLQRFHKNKHLFS